MSAPAFRPPLICTVRACGLPLERGERAFACAAGHAFDLARSGYVNLLQPNDRRSLAAGDAKETVAARARLFERGVGRALVAELGERLAGLGIGARSRLLELGCGPGFALEALAARTGAAAIGIDLSAHAIDAAARRAGAHAWVVANADHGLPVAAGSIDAALSIAGPRPAAELARVLAPAGRAIVCVPAAGDLAELRAELLGDGPPIERADKALAALAGEFELVARATVGERHELDAQGVADLLSATYRGARRSEAARAAGIAALAVTVASDVLVLAPRRGRGAAAVLE